MRLVPAQHPQPSTPAGSSAALTITTGGANGRPFTLGALASGLRLAAAINVLWFAWFVGDDAEATVEDEDVITPMLPWLV